MRCPKCGHEIDRENPVCAGCGATLKVKALKLPEKHAVKIPQKFLDENKALIEQRLAERTGVRGRTGKTPKDPFSGFSVLKGCAKFMRFCHFYGWGMIALCVLSGIILTVDTVKIEHSGVWSDYYEETTQMAQLFGETWIGWAALAISCVPLVWRALFSKAEAETISMQIQAGRRLRIVGSKATGNAWYWVGSVGALLSFIGGCSLASQQGNGWFVVEGLWVGGEVLLFFCFLACLCRLQTWAKRFAQKCMELPEPEVGTGGTAKATAQGHGERSEAGQKCEPNGDVSVTDDSGTRGGGADV